MTLLTVMIEIEGSVTGVATLSSERSHEFTEGQESVHGRREVQSSPFFAEDEQHDNASEKTQFEVPLAGGCTCVTLLTGSADGFPPGVPGCGAYFEAHFACSCLA